jgi:hypothetical protein
VTIFIGLDYGAILSDITMTPIAYYGVFRIQAADAISLENPEGFLPISLDDYG